MAESNPETATPDLGIDLEGQHDHTVDDKGRVSIPAQFRTELGLEDGDELVVTRHLKEDCLLVFRKDAWAAFKAGATRRPGPVANAIRRVMKGSARRVKLDRLGRISLPAALRAQARLDSRCFVMGQGSWIEIWNVDLWNACHGPAQYESYDLSEFGL